MCLFGVCVCGLVGGGGCLLVCWVLVGCLFICLLGCCVCLFSSVGVCFFLSLYPFIDVFVCFALTRGTLWE